MAQHMWGELGVDWAGIDAAANYLGDYCKRRALLTGQTKEKFGTVRFYAHFGHLSLHSIVYPGYVYSQFPKWLWSLDCWYIGPVLRFFFERPFVWWQIRVYSRAYLNACEKWPHLQAEILCAADQPELISGRTWIETRKDEVHTHIIDLQGKEVGCWVSTKYEQKGLGGKKEDIRTRRERFRALREIGCPLVYSVIKAVFKL